MALTLFEGYEFLQQVIKTDPWLLARPEFSGDVRTYQRERPAGTPTYPFVLIRYVVGIPLMALGGIEVYTDLFMDVLVVNRSNEIKTMKPIVNYLDTRLHRTSGTTTDGEIFFCMKAEGYQEIATTDPPVEQSGARVQNLGRTWHMYAKGPD